jgi:hypothetical protein
MQDEAFLRATGSVTSWQACWMLSRASVKDLCLMSWDDLVAKFANDLPMQCLVQTYIHTSILMLIHISTFVNRNKIKDI